MTRARCSAVRSRTPLVALAGALLLAGCGSGQNPQTYQPKAAADSSDVTIGDLAIRDLSVSAPTSGTVLAQGSDAPVTITVVDNGSQPDILQGAQSPAAASVDVVTRSAATASAGAGSSSPGSSGAASPSATASPSDTAGPSATATPSDTASPGATATPGGGTSAGVILAVPAGGTTGQQYSLILRNLTAPLSTGTYIQLTLSFQRNGTRTLTVPVAVTDSDTTLPRPSDYKIPDEDSAGNPITP